MTSSRFKFLRRVRIHGGECGAVARALHHEAQKSASSQVELLLISDECSSLRQAEPKKAFGSTIERKQMSTKTSIKRLALVAVSALGFGLLSIAPSSASVQSDSVTLASATSSTTAGVAATNTLSISFIDSDGLATANTVNATLAVLSSPSTSTALPVITNTTTAETNGTRSISGLVASLASTGSGTTAARVAGSFTLTLTPTVAGTYVIRVTPGSGALNTAAITWTVTVAASLTPTAADSTEILNAGNGTTDATDATVTASRAINNAAGQQKATIVVTPRVAPATAPASTVALTATISGPGTLGIGTVVNAALITPSGRAITGGAGEYAIGVFSDGTSGVATITVSAGTTVLGTETVTFFGDAASITPTVVNSVIATGNTNAANIGAITAVVRDAAGVVVAGTEVFAVSSATTTISNNYSTCGLSSATGSVSCTLNGVAAGTATITLTTNSSATSTTGISATPVSIRVGSTTPASVRLSFDKASYVPGERATLSVQLLDSTGLPVVNGAYTNIFTAAGLSSSLALATGTLPTTGITAATSTGTQAVVVNMPLVAGKVTISGTGGTGLPAAAQVAVSAEATVTGGEAIDAANAASDAALEAIDAANAATDAANLAAEAADAATVAAEEARDAADAATAAVEALASEVATLIAGLKAQITTLANTVAKIAKKVRA